MIRDVIGDFFLMGWRCGGRSSSTCQNQQSSLINQKRTATRALGEFSLSIAPGNRLEIIFASHWLRSSFALLQFSSILQFLPFNVQCSMFNVQCSMFNVHLPPRSGGLRSAMPMASQFAERITPHGPHMDRRFGDHPSLSRTSQRSSSLYLPSSR
jgi:hypothetical protein